MILYVISVQIVSILLSACSKYQFLKLDYQPNFFLQLIIIFLTFYIVGKSLVFSGLFLNNSLFLYLNWTMMTTKKNVDLYF